MSPNPLYNLIKIENELKIKTMKKKSQKPFNKHKNN